MLINPRYKGIVVSNGERPQTAEVLDMAAPAKAAAMITNVGKNVENH
jgi:hypothetical protein